jgi:hypothetical protein
MPQMRHEPEKGAVMVVTERVEQYEPAKLP